MQWNIVDGRIIGFKKDNEDDNYVPAGVRVRNGRIVSIRFPYGKYAIGKSLCEDIATLETVVIPTGVTEIENSAFYNCKNLISITIPDSVRNIEKNAFKGTIYDIDSVNLKSDVLYIGNILIEVKNT